MHTVENYSDGYGVIFIYGDGSILHPLPVKDLTLDEACRLVNYLNGGTGDESGYLRRIKEVIEGA